MMTDVAPQKSYCAKCNMPIFWAELTTGRRHPVNWIEDAPAELQKNNWQTGLTKGSIVYAPGLGLYRIIKSENLKAYLRVGGSVAQSHFDTCPFADEFRKGRKK